MRVRPNSASMTNHTDILVCSHSIRERAEYYTGAEDARAPESPVHLQFAVQLSRHRIHVSSLFPSTAMSF